MRQGAKHEYSFAKEVEAGNVAMMTLLNYTILSVCSQVTAGGRAAQGGLAEGDYILAINEQPTDLLKHLEAQQIIKKARENITLMWWVSGFSQVVVVDFSIV